MRGEIDPIFPDNDYLRYFIVDLKNTKFLTTDLVLNKENKEISMNIIFDNDEIGKYIANKIESDELILKMRGISNKEGDFRLICFDIIPIEKSKMR